MANVLSSPGAPSEYGSPPNSGEALGGHAGRIINMITTGLPKSPNSVRGTTRFHASDMPSSMTIPETGPFHEISASVGQIGGESLPRLTGLSMMWGRKDATPDADGVTHLRTTLDLIPDGEGLRRVVTQEIRLPGATDSRTVQQVDHLDGTNIDSVAAQVEEHGIRPFQQPTDQAQ